MFRSDGGAVVFRRAQEQLPCYIDLTEGCRNNMAAMAGVPLAKGSVLAFDMGSTSFEQWQACRDQCTHG